MSKPSAMQDLQALVRRGAEDLGLLGQVVLVAVSGGPDSVALFDLLGTLARQGDLALHLCHVDHGWRPEAARAEAELCVGLAERAGAGWSVVHLPPGLAQSEAGARAARHAALLRVAAGVGARAIALGHQADDQAETVLLQLVRGTAAAGGMAPWRDPLWRPLLAVTHRDLERYCDDRGLRYATDPTNASPAFARNRVRHAVMPLLQRENPRVAEALGRFAALRREDDAWLEDRAEDQLRQLPPLPNGLDLRPLAAQPLPLQRRALQRVFARLGLALTAERLRDVQDVLQSGGRLSPALHLRLAAGLLTWTVPALPWCALPPGARLRWGDLLFGVGEAPPGAVAAEVGPGALSVRPRRPGDRVRTPGGTRKLQDILVDAKVPRTLRDFLPVVCRDGRPVWLPGRLRAADAGDGTTVWAGSAEVVAQLWSVLE